MANDHIISTDTRTGRVPPAKKSGFYYNWGPQAWIDMWMSRSMLVKNGMIVISHTFLPMLRLCADQEQINRDYQKIRAHREPIKLFDSPREKWRKAYGNFVREIEWCLLELRKHYSQQQYEDIVIGTNIEIAKETSSDFLERMSGASDRFKGKKHAPAKDGETEKPSRWMAFLFANFNPAHWLTGPANIPEFSPAKGQMVMEIPQCGWHICAAQNTLPNPDALPEEGCLLICKGLFEALFNGEKGGLKMQFDPHLPETSCTVRMSWKTD
jgi:hypothetical protein